VSVSKALHCYYQLLQYISRQ